MSGDDSSLIYPETSGPMPADSPALAALLDALQGRFKDSLQAVMLYGSCLRSGDLFDGLVDLYAIVDHYGNAYDSRRLRLGNALLAPNVFYLEVAVGDQRVRCKYAVLSLRDFERGTSSRWFESYLWGRFAQPVSLVFSRDAQTAERMRRCRERAAEIFVRRALPALPPTGSIADLWEGALALSYATELRSERAGRPRQLVDANLPFLEAVTLGLAPRLADRMTLQRAEDGGYRYQSTVSTLSRRLALSQWFLRRVEGKLLSVLRLLKGLFTFEGGLDYIVWKLERHSGQEIQLPDKVRRRPLLHIWGFFWQLYRRGVFR